MSLNQILKENEEIRNVKQQINSKLEKMNIDMNNLSIESKRFIGRDTFENEYYVKIINLVLQRYSKQTFYEE